MSGITSTFVPLRISMPAGDVADDMCRCFDRDDRIGAVAHAWV